MKQLIDCEQKHQSDVARKADTKIKRVSPIECFPFCFLRVPGTISLPTHSQDFRLFDQKQFIVEIIPKNEEIRIVHEDCFQSKNVGYQNDSQGSQWEREA